MDDRQQLLNFDQVPEAAAAPSRTDSQTSQPSPLTFWCLVLMASVAFAPCVIVPLWQDYRALKTAEQLEMQTVERMRADAVRHERHLQGLREDPLVVTRVAKRELYYSRPNEQSVRIGALNPRSARQSPPPLPNIQPPAAIERFLSRLPLSSHWRIYCDRSKRTMLICLCGATVIAAFLTFPPKRAKRTTRHSASD